MNEMYLTMGKGKYNTPPLPHNIVDQSQWETEQLINERDSDKERGAMDETEQCLLVQQSSHTYYTRLLLAEWSVNMNRQWAAETLSPEGHIENIEISKAPLMHSAVESKEHTKIHWRDFTTSTCSGYRNNNT